MPKPLVAIVGRPNVGKSTLFNRLTGRRIAVVDYEPGVTRDRIYADCEWNQREFTIIDTGGIQPTITDPLAEKVRNQVQLAIDESDVILFITDAKDGLAALDFQVGELLRKTNKPQILVVNKVEGKMKPEDLTDFFQLGLGDFIPISALHGTNIDTLLNQTVKLLPAEKMAPPPPPADLVKVAIVGRTNVGKSSLLNAILNEERVVVDKMPGTTRDAIDTYFKSNDRPFLLIDTAGIKRKAKITTAIEYYSILRAIRAIERADVTLLVIDAPQGVTEQDKHIGGLAKNANKACIIIVNKWDLMQKIVDSIKRKELKLMKDYQRIIYQQMPFLKYAPLLFTSALKCIGIPEIIAQIKAVACQYHTTLPTEQLNQIIKEAIATHTPPTRDGKRLRIYYAEQPYTQPPTIHLFVNDPKLMHFSYQRYLENKIREKFNLSGSPIRFILQPKRKLKKHKPKQN